MCRLLFVKSSSEFNTANYLKTFSQTAKNSKEFQGHGWGCSYLKDNEWIHYKNIIPVWEDDLSEFPDTKILVAHARSAFKDEGITVENNMPFYDERYIFIFNGELRGVKLNSGGRIGAEKIFNFIKRFDKGNMFEAIERAVDIIKKRTSYIRAMNFIICDKNKTFVCSLFNEDTDYFTMYYKNDQSLVISSEKFSDEDEWKPIQNNSLLQF